KRSPPSKPSSAAACGLVTAVCVCLKFLKAPRPWAAASVATMTAKTNARAAAERRTADSDARIVPSARPSRSLQFPGHFDHRSPKAQTRKQPLRALVLLGGAEHHPRRAYGTEPLTGGLHERTRHTVPLGFGDDDDVVDVPRRLAQFLPR